MTWDFQKKTGLIKPFSNIEEWDQYVEDSNKLPQLDAFANSPMKKSKIKKGMNEVGEKFDSFAEYAFTKYMRLIKGYIVERNKVQFLNYIDPVGKMRKFHPDFYVNGAPCEVKGRVTETDRCKLEQCPQVTWYFQSDINAMADELSKQFPNWRSDFHQTN